MAPGSHPGSKRRYKEERRPKVALAAEAFIYGYPLVAELSRAGAARALRCKQAKGAGALDRLAA